MLLLWESAQQISAAPCLEWDSATGEMLQRPIGFLAGDLALWAFQNWVSTMNKVIFFVGEEAGSKFNMIAMGTFLQIQRSLHVC